MLRSKLDQYKFRMSVLKIGLYIELLLIKEIKTLQTYDV